MKPHLSRLISRRAPRLAALLPRFLCLAAFLSATLARPSERWATLEAIHQIENPRNSEEPGRYGEMGPYQFREGTWRMHTLAPFSCAVDRRVSDAVAVKHYNWLKEQIERRGASASPYSIALAWNGGIRAVFSLRPPAAAVDYASRAASLAAQLQHQELADAR